MIYKRFLVVSEWVGEGFVKGVGREGGENKNID